MIDSFNLGQIIYNLISGNAELFSHLKKKDEKTHSTTCKIYPLVADNSVTLPFVVYRRESLSSNTTKDWTHEDDVTFSIKIISETYAESILIANLIRNVFEKEQIAMNDITLNDTRIQNSTEEFSDNSFIQTLIFQTKLS